MRVESGAPGLELRGVPIPGVGGAKVLEGRPSETSDLCRLFCEVVRARLQEPMAVEQVRELKR